MGDKRNDPEINTVPSVRPFTRYRAIEMGVCAVCIVLGVLYLYAGVLPLSVLMPCYAVGFCSIPILQYADLRAAGKRGIVNYIPVIFWGVISAIVIIATIYYFVG